MKAGMSLLQAMEQVTREMGPPIRQEFAHALQENQVGKPIIQALHDMTNRIQSEDLDLTVNAIGIAQETGGVLSDLLVKMAESIRSRNRVRAKINTLSAQGTTPGDHHDSSCRGSWRASIAMLDPGMMRPMFTTTTGPDHACRHRRSRVPRLAYDPTDGRHRRLGGLCYSPDWQCSFSPSSSSLSSSSDGTPAGPSRRRSYRSQSEEDEFRSRGSSHSARPLVRALAAYGQNLPLLGLKERYAHQIRTGRAAF